MKGMDEMWDMKCMGWMGGITKIKDIWKKDGSMQEYGWKMDE